MKVCFIGGTRYNQPVRPTVEKKFQLLEMLGQVYVVAFSVDSRPRRFSQHACFYLLPCLPMPLLRYVLMFTVGPILALWCILRHDVRILVAQSPYEGFAAAWAKKIAGWFGRKVVLVVENHGDFEESIFLQRQVLLPSLYRFLMRYAARLALKHADVLRAISTVTRVQLERWAPGKPLVEFATWTDIEVFLAAIADGQKDANAIVYVGMLIPRKGVHFLLDAFAQVRVEFPNAQLWIIGKPENGEYTRSLKMQVERLALNERVVFRGHLPQAELARYMARAQALVLPSVSEGLGRVVVEAMACGTLVIGSRVGGIPEMIEDGVTGFLVPPGDVGALSDRIRWVLTHPDEARQIEQRAREFAQRFFSPQAYLQGYSQLFLMARDAMNG